MKKKILQSLLLAGGLACLAPTAQAQQTINLFNGNDLNNWNIVLEEKDDVKPEDVFSIRNGIIHCKGNPFGYLYTKEKYDNFRLHVEWCYPEEATNSGIFLFIQEPGKVWPNAVECQLHKGDAGDFVLLNGSDLKEFTVPAGEKRPAFPVVKKKESSAEMAPGEWNNADITCKNGTITVFINGVYQNYGSESLHKSGHIGLQSEGKDILFRNVRLTPL